MTPSALRVFARLSRENAARRLMPGWQVSGVPYAAPKRQARPSGDGTHICCSMTSKLPDTDMQDVLPALLRAPRKAGEIAWQTGTAIVVMRDGKLIEETVTEFPQWDS